MTYVIAGLGNPTKKYEKTRHNAGFETVDILAEAHGIVWKKSMFQAMVGKGMIAGKKVILVKPLTFMNLSGNAIQKVLRFYRVDAASEAGNYLIVTKKRYGTD